MQRTRPHSLLPPKSTVGGISPRPEALSAMDEGLLTLELPRAPNHHEWMRCLLPIIPISRAHRMVAYVAGDYRRKLPLSLSRRALEEEDEPDRWVPPVGETAESPGGAPPLVRFSIREDVIPPKYAFIIR